MWTPWTRRGVQPESPRGRPSLHSGQLHFSNSIIFHAQREIELRFLLQLIEGMKISYIMVPAHIRDADRGAGEPRCVTTCSDPYQTRSTLRQDKICQCSNRDNHSLSLVFSMLESIQSPCLQENVLSLEDPERTSGPNRTYPTVICPAIPYHGPQGLYTD